MLWSEIPHAPDVGTEIGPLGDFPDGGVRMLAFGPQAQGDKPFRLLVLRSAESVFGYVNRCAHFGVPLAASAEHLVFKPHISISCNVHYARYNWTDGTCVLGDCDGESLIPVPLVVREEKVVIAG